MLKSFPSLQWTCRKRKGYRKKSSFLTWHREERLSQAAWDTEGLRQRVPKSEKNCVTPLRLSRVGPPRLAKRFSLTEQPCNAVLFRKSSAFTRAADLTAADLVSGRVGGVAVDSVVELATNEFRRSNSLSAGEQSGTLERLSQNAVLASSADWNPAFFQGGSGGNVESDAVSISGERLRF